MAAINPQPDDGTVSVALAPHLLDHSALAEIASKSPRPRDESKN